MGKWFTPAVVLLLAVALGACGSRAVAQWNKTHPPVDTRIDRATSAVARARVLCSDFAAVSTAHDSVARGEASDQVLYDVGSILDKGLFPARRANHGRTLDPQTIIKLEKTTWAAEAAKSPDAYLATAILGMSDLAAMTGPSAARIVRECRPYAHT